MAPGVVSGRKAQTWLMAAGGSLGRFNTCMLHMSGFPKSKATWADPIGSWEAMESSYSTNPDEPVTHPQDLSKSIPLRIDDITYSEIRNRYPKMLPTEESKWAIYEAMCIWLSTVGVLQPVDYPYRSWVLARNVDVVSDLSGVKSAAMLSYLMESSRLKMSGQLLSLASSVAAGYATAGPAGAFYALAAKAVEGAFQARQGSWSWGHQPSWTPSAVHIAAFKAVGPSPKTGQLMSDYGMV